MDLGKWNPKQLLRYSDHTLYILVETLNRNSILIVNFRDLLQHFSIYLSSIPDNITST